MNKIPLIIVDSHPIVSDGIEALLSDVDDIGVVAKVRDINHLFPEIRRTRARIVLVNIYRADEEDIETISAIRKRHSEVKILILSMSSEEQFILKTLKAGAKGYLSKDTYRNQLIEAIYTLRGGYEYYSKSISTAILRSYMSNNGSNGEAKKERDLKCLSTREKEVLKHFVDGLGNQEIAEQLFISVRTVESHKTNIMQKLQLKTAIDLVKFAIRNNMIKV